MDVEPVEDQSKAVWKGHTGIPYISASLCIDLIPQARSIVSLHLQDRHRLW